MGKKLDWFSHGQKKCRQCSHHFSVSIYTYFSFAKTFTTIKSVTDVVINVFVQCLTLRYQTFQFLPECEVW